MEESTTTRVIPDGGGPDRSEAAVRFGIASAARDVGISVAIVLGLLYLFPVLARVMGSPRWDGGPPPGGPIAAGLKLQARTGLGSLAIGAWVGPGLFVGLAVSALVVGGLLLRFCDASAADGTCRRQPCSGSVAPWAMGRTRPTAPGTRR